MNGEMYPYMLFLERYKKDSLSRTPMFDGIWPERVLPLRSRWATWEKYEKLINFKLLNFRSTESNLVKFPKLGGIEPLKSL